MEPFSDKRCYKPKEFGMIADVQFHHFSDASEVGYGAVSHLRFIDADSKVHLFVHHVQDPLSSS